MNRRGFTLIEVMIALGLSSLLMLGLVQLNQGLLKWLNFVRATNTTQQIMALVFNQFECDVSAAYIPDLSRPEKIKEDGGAAKDATKEPELPQDQKNDQTKEEPEKEKEKRKKFIDNAFKIVVDENADAKKIQDMRRYPVTYMSFITTNALSVYGQRRQQLVRVVYALEKAKGQKHSERQLYSLMRKETHDLENITAKIDQFRPIEQQDITSYLIVPRVLGVYVDCTVLPRDLVLRNHQLKIKESMKKEPEGNSEPLHHAQWGFKEEFSGFVPRSITLWIELVNQRDQVEMFSFTCQIHSYGDFLYTKTQAAHADKPQRPKQAEQPGDAEQASEQQSQDQLAPVALEGD